MRSSVRSFGKPNSLAIKTAMAFALAGSPVGAAEPTTLSAHQQEIVRRINGQLNATDIAPEYRKALTDYRDAVAGGAQLPEIAPVISQAPATNVSTAAWVLVSAQAAALLAAIAGIVILVAKLRAANANSATLKTKLEASESECDRLTQILASVKSLRIALDETNRRISWDKLGGSPEDMKAILIEMADAFEHIDGIRRELEDAQALLAEKNKKIEKDATIKEIDDAKAVSLDTQLKDAKAELAAAIEKFASTGAHIAGALQKAAVAEAAAQQERLRADGAEGKIADLEQELALAKTADMVEAAATIARLENRIAELSGLSHEAEGRRNNAELATDGLRKRIADLEGILTSTSGAHAAELADLRLRLEAKEKSRLAAVGELHRNETESQAKIAELERAQALLREEIGAARAEITELKEQLTNERAQAVRLREETIREYEAAKRHMVDVHLAEKEILEQRAELSDAARVDAEARLYNAQQDHKAALTNLGADHARHIGDLNVRIAQLDADLASTKELLQLSDTREEASQKTLQAAQGQLATANGVIGDLENDKKTVQADLGAALVEITGLKATIKTAGMAASVEELHRNAERAAEELRANEEFRRESRELAKNQRAESDRQAAELKAQHVASIRQTEEAQKEHDAAQKALVIRLCGELQTAGTGRVDELVGHLDKALAGKMDEAARKELRELIGNRDFNSLAKPSIASVVEEMIKKDPEVGRVISSLILSRANDISHKAAGDIQVAAEASVQRITADLDAHAQAIAALVEDSRAVALKKIEELEKQAAWLVKKHANDRSTVSFIRDREAELKKLRGDAQAAKSPEELAQVHEDLKPIVLVTEEEEAVLDKAGLLSGPHEDAQEAEEAKEIFQMTVENAKLVQAQIKKETVCVIDAADGRRTISPPPASEPAASGRRTISPASAAARAQEKLPEITAAVTRPAAAQPAFRLSIEDARKALVVVQKEVARLGAVAYASPDVRERTERLSALEVTLGSAIIKESHETGGQVTVDNPTFAEMTREILAQLQAQPVASPAENPAAGTKSYAANTESEAIRASQRTGGTEMLSKPGQAQEPVAPKGTPAQQPAAPKPSNDIEIVVTPTGRWAGPRDKPTKPHSAVSPSASVATPLPLPTASAADGTVDVSISGPHKAIKVPEKKTAMTPTQEVEYQEARKREIKKFTDTGFMLPDRKGKTPMTIAEALFFKMMREGVLEIIPEGTTIDLTFGTKKFAFRCNDKKRGDFSYRDLPPMDDDPKEEKCGFKAHAKISPLVNGTSIDMSGIALEILKRADAGMDRYIHEVNEDLKKGGKPTKFKKDINTIDAFANAVVCCLIALKGHVSGKDKELLDAKNAEMEALTAELTKKHEEAKRISREFKVVTPFSQQ